MSPTKDRNHPSIIIRYNGEVLMFDCGEGTQRQLKYAGISPQKIKNIFITHWHGDHVLGLPGLLQTIAANDQQEEITIYGPKNTKEKITTLLEIFPFQNSLKLNIKDIEQDEKIILKNQYFEIKAIKLQHSIDTFGYSFIEKSKINIDKEKMKKLNIQEGPHLKEIKLGKPIKINNKTIKPEDIGIQSKGKKITYITDTLLCENAIKLAQNSDILICESTYSKEHQDLADERLHMSSEDAATLANQSESKKLILFHFSQRYKDTNKLVQEAKTIFPNTLESYDLMKIKF